MTMLHAGASARTLGVVRIWVFGIWLLRILPDCVACFADFPPFLFARVGVMRLLPKTAVPWLFDPSLLAMLKTVLVVLLAAALLGIRPYRVIAVAASGVLTIVEAIPAGLAQNTHVDLALLYVTYVLAISPAADAFALRRQRQPRRPAGIYAGAMMTMTLLLLLTYAFVATRRLTLSSPEIFIEPTMRYFVASDILRPTHSPFLLGEWLLRHPHLLPLIQTGFGVTTVFELAAPLCLICTRFRYVWIVTMVAFHVGSYVLMNVVFLSNVLLFPVLLLDLGRATEGTHVPQPDKFPLSGRGSTIRS